MDSMKKVFCGAIMTLSILMLNACSYSQDADIAKITLKNDLAVPAKVELCKGDPHCEAIEVLWPAKVLAANESSTITITKGVKTIFRVSADEEGKARVNCLRVNVGRQQHADVDAQLSAATAC